MVASLAHALQLPILEVAEVLLVVELQPVDPLVKVRIRLTSANSDRNLARFNNLLLAEMRL